MEPETGTTLGVSIAGVGLQMHAPEKIMGVLRATLSSVPTIHVGTSPMEISATQHDSGWEVRTTSGSRKLLDPKSTPTQIAGALVSSAVSEVATARSLHTMRATVVEHDGSALAMIGADWESTVTIATHLHTRGWRYLSGDHALHDSEASSIVGFSKALYVTSSSIGHLPVAYRGAIEASPWCVTRHGISFYAVDPAMVGSASPWAATATLRAVLLVDGRADDLPALETFGPTTLTNDRLAHFSVDRERQAVAELTVGSYVETCDLIERWFASLDS